MLACRPTSKNTQNPKKTPIRGYIYIVSVYDQKEQAYCVPQYSTQAPTNYPTYPPTKSTIPPHQIINPHPIRSSKSYNIM
jgi:hypothetical protein